MLLWARAIFQLNISAFFALSTITSSFFTFFVLTYTLHNLWLSWFSQIRFRTLLSSSFLKFSYWFPTWSLHFLDSDIFFPFPPFCCWVDPVCCGWLLIWFSAVWLDLNPRTVKLVPLYWLISTYIGWEYISIDEQLSIFKISRHHVKPSQHYVTYALNTLWITLVAYSFLAAARTVSSDR